MWTPPSLIKIILLGGADPLSDLVGDVFESAGVFNVGTSPRKCWVILKFDEV